MAVLTRGPITFALVVLCGGCAAQPAIEAGGAVTLPEPSAASSGGTAPSDGEGDAEPMLRTLPGTSWNSRYPIHNTNFSGLNSLTTRAEQTAGVGQTVRVTEPFELRRIGMYFESNVTFALPTLWDFPYETDFRILREHIVSPGPLDDAGVVLGLTLYRSPQDDGFPTIRRPTSGPGAVPFKERDVIRRSDMVLVSEQLLQGEVRAGTGLTVLELTEPVTLQPGHWLLAFRVDSVEGELDLLDLPIRGMEHGNNRVEDAPDGARCEYRAAAERYPDGAFYWLALQPDEHFIPAFAKVQQCVEYGRYEDWTPLNPGDIGLDLFGEPVG